MNSGIVVYNTNMSVQNVNKAIELRRSGYSYADIAKELGVSKASVCGWVKNVRLTEAEKLHLNKNITRKIEKGRMMASITIRSRKVYKEKVAYDDAEKEFKKLMMDSQFMLGIGLCSTSGLKKGNSLQFSSPDPVILKIMTNWLEKYLKVPKNIIKYRIIGKNKEHRGYSCVVVSRIEVIRKVIAWQKLTMRYYG